MASFGVLRGYESFKIARAVPQPTLTETLALAPFGRTAQSDLLCATPSLGESGGGKGIA